MSWLSDTSWLGAQLWLCGAAFVAGLMVAIAYYAYGRILFVRKRRHPFAGYMFSDSIFVAVVSILVICYWLVVAQGNLRPADFIWMGCGFAFARSMIFTHVKDHSNKKPLKEKSPAAYADSGLNKERKKKASTPTAHLPQKMATSLAMRVMVVPQRMQQKWENRAQKRRAEKAAAKEADDFAVNEDAYSEEKIFPQK